MEPAVAGAWGRDASAGEAVSAPPPFAAGVPRPEAPAGRPRRRGAPALAFGMDDPALLPNLGDTALDAGSSRPRPALTYWVVADERREGAPPPRRSRPAGPQAGRPEGALVLAAATVLGAISFASTGVGVAAWGGWPPAAAALSGAAAGSLLAWGILGWKVRRS